MRKDHHNDDVIDSAVAQLSAQNIT